VLLDEIVGYQEESDNLDDYDNQSALPARQRLLNGLNDSTADPRPTSAVDDET